MMPTNSDYIFSLCFETSAIETQLDILSKEELQMLIDKLSCNPDCILFDIFVADFVPAVRAGDPDQVIIGLNRTRAGE